MSEFENYLTKHSEEEIARRIKRDQHAKARKVRHANLNRQRPPRQEYTRMNRHEAFCLLEDELWGQEAAEGLGTVPEGEEVEATSN